MKTSISNLLSRTIWNGTHTTKITKKANSTSAFLRRKLRSFPQDNSKSACLSLVRSALDYGSIIWDPYLQQDIDKLECVLRQAVHFITGDYRTHKEGCVTGMLQMLELSSLEQQCSFNRLVFLYKVVKGLVPAIPPNAFLKQQNLKDKSNKDSSRITSPETLLKGIVLKTISVLKLKTLRLSSWKVRSS